MKTPADNYIRTHPRSPFLWYVRDVPKDVRSIIGKTRWKQSLGTSSRLAALREADRLAARHHDEIEAARIEAGSVDPASRLSSEERIAIGNAGGLKAYLAWLDSRANEALRKMDEADMWREDAQDPHPESPDTDDANARAFGLDAERREIERQIGANVGTLDRLGLTSVALRDRRHHALADSVSVRPNRETMSLSSALEKWKAVKEPTTPEQYEYPVWLFEQLHGGMPLSEITEDHVRDFRDALRKVPTASGSKFKGMSLRNMIEYADRRDLPRLGETTAAKYFGSVKTIFRFAKLERYVESNPADGIGWHARKQKFSAARKRKRRSFAPAELSTLLEAAEKFWTGKNGLENHWFLKLMIWTGARPEELSQLAPGDVRKVGDVLCLHLHDEGQNKLKSEAGVRIIPVHPSLLAQGFTEFVESRRTAPYLFTSLKADGRGRRYTRMGRRLTALMHTRAKFTDPRLVPYSARHAFKDACRLAGAPEEVQEVIMGHASPERAVARDYGDGGQVAVLDKWMRTIDPLDRRRTVSEFEET
jgi:integrase